MGRKKTVSRRKNKSRSKRKVSKRKSRSRSSRKRAVINYLIVDDPYYYRSNKRRQVPGPNRAGVTSMPCHTYHGPGACRAVGCDWTTLYGCR